MKFIAYSAYYGIEEMKIPLVLCLLLAVVFPLGTVGNCILSASEFTCRETNLNDLLQEFYEESSESNWHSPQLAINIVDSNYNVIEHFPNLPSTSHKFIINTLAIRNSSVEHISSNALEDLSNLVKLDLSWNKLRNILFVESLPKHLKHLNLSHNNVAYLDNVFGKLRSLFYLDLSHNRISIIDFSNVYWVQHLNFSANSINTLITSTSNNRINEIDLSHNQITEFSEAKLNILFYRLDISYNKLKFINLSGIYEKSLLNLSGNNGIIKTLSSVDHWVVIHDVDLSYSDISNWEDSRVLATKRLILKNNKVPKLDNSTINIFSNYREQFQIRISPLIDLSNSSIADIAEYHFGDIKLKALNLSWNNITDLRNNIFRHSTINVLDLSYSNIKRIKSNAFKDLVCKQINLKGNKLINIRNNFNEVSVEHLDLSFNQLQSVSNNSFGTSRDIRILNMSNCFIERIEPQAFFNLKNLEVLDLSYNKLHILEKNMFNSLQVKDLRLQLNKIDTIRTGAFNNLHNLKVLDLSRVGLRDLESQAFINLSRTEVVDLRYNNISTVPDSLFVNMENLQTVYLDENNITTLHTFSNRLKLHNLTLTFSGNFKSNQILNLNIQYFNLKSSRIDILKNNSFAGMYNLVDLRLENTYVRHIEPGALNNLFNLKFLDSQIMFKHTKVLRTGTFIDLKSLEFLNLSSLSLETLEAKAFVGLRNLKSLVLSKNNLSRLEEGTFYGLQSLKTLDLSHSNIDSCDDRCFAGLKNLETLHLEFNNLSEIHSDILFHSLGQLLELHLEHNSISSLDINSFSGLKNIRQLYLQNNSIQEFPIGLFHYLSTLKSLNLSNNNIQLLKTGALSNLQSLEILDLSDNELVNLEYVDIFFSLKHLEIVRFDGNHLKQFDFRRFLINLRKIKYVGISHNKWKCDTLSYIIESFNNRSVDYKPENPVYNDDNIDGVGCVDLCKFVYCSHENVEQTLH